MRPRTALLRPNRSILALTLFGALLAPGCTIVKPVACAVAYPPVQVAERIDRASDPEDDDLPAPVLFLAAPVLIPINYVYWTVHGAVSGLFSGFVNDLNLVTGNGTFDRTWDTMLEPLKTNAKPSE